jgi:5'-nucleotidase
MKLTHSLKWIVPSLLVVAAVAGGCTNKKSTAQQSASKYPPMNQAVLDIPATPPPPAAPPATFTPGAPPQPVVYDAPSQQPVVEEPVADASESAAPVHSSAPRARRASASVAPAGTKYKIKKGESLWSIAQARYGNGNKWKTIAAANPKLDPNKVQAGQTITLP